MDVGHCGGWTQILGSKASEPEPSQSVVKTQYLPTACAVCASVEGDPIGIS